MNGYGSKRHEVKIVTASFKDQIVASASFYIEKDNMRQVGHIFDVMINNEYEKRFELLN